MIFYLFMSLLHSYKFNLPRNMVDFSATKNHQTCGKNEESKHVDLTGNDGELNNQKWCIFPKENGKIEWFKQENKLGFTKQQ